MLVGSEQLDIPLWAMVALSLGYFRGTMQPLSMASYLVKAQTGSLVSSMAKGFIDRSTFVGYFSNCGRNETGI